MSEIKAKKADVWWLVARAFPHYTGRKFTIRPSTTITFWDTNWSGGTRSQYAAVRLGRACTSPPLRGRTRWRGGQSKSPMGSPSSSTASPRERTWGSLCGYGRRVWHSRYEVGLDLKDFVNRHSLARHGHGLGDSPTLSPGRPT